MVMNFEIKNWDFPAQESRYASAERLSVDDMCRQVNLVGSFPELTSKLDEFLILALVMNEKRQIVFANRAFLKETQWGETLQPIGLRFGEAVKCHHAYTSGLECGGCGTTEACKTCKVMNIFTAIREGEEFLGSASLYLHPNKDQRDLRIWATPLVVEEEKFILVEFDGLTDQTPLDRTERSLDELCNAFM